MLTLDQVTHVHLEISSRCNAACPLCPRNLNGYPYNNGYVEHDMTLAQAQTIFQPQFVSQLRHLLINGNFGDMVMNPDTVEIIEYMRSHNQNLDVIISTNGGARDRNFWSRMALTGAQVQFCIDGLEDIHSWYRQNTVYAQVLRNAEIFIQAGGHAVWKMIQFDHNLHQIAQARTLSQQLGFRSFKLIQGDRTQGPVFNQRGELVRIMGQVPDYQLDLAHRLQDLNQDMPMSKIIHYFETRPNIRCQSVQLNSIYVSSTGDVYPCCWTGFSPQTFGRGTYFQAANGQFRHMIQRNNALEYDMATCIEWFEQIARTWNHHSFAQGRLLVCNNNCGQKT